MVGEPGAARPLPSASGASVSSDPIGPMRGSIVESKRVLGAVAVVGAAVLLLLAWPGLALPVDFQVDPNLSHVLYGLHLADTRLFSNVFYPAFVNFMAYALAIKLAGIPLASDPAFAFASIERAIQAARAAQFVVAACTVAAWLFAIRQWLFVVRREFACRTDSFAYPITMVLAATLLVFNYGMVYSAYFLRPDNALSATVALGLLVLARVFDGVRVGRGVDARWLIAFGSWIFAMTATKSQGQILILAAVLFVAFVSYRVPTPFIASTAVRRWAAALVVVMLAVLLVRSVPMWGALVLQHRILLVMVASCGLLALVSGTIAARFERCPILLLVTAGWSVGFLVVSTLLPREANVHNLLSISNPAYTIIEQLSIHNVKFGWAPIAFAFVHLGTIDGPLIVACLIGLCSPVRKPVAILFGVGIVLLLLASLRLAGYYNLVLIVPPFVAAASVVAYWFLSGHRAMRALQVAIPASVLFAVTNMTLHQRHIDAHQNICTMRGSLASVAYDPDTIAVESSLLATGKIYFRSYAKAIFLLNYWPEIIARLKDDPQTQAFLSGDARTCH